MGLTTVRIDQLRCIEHAELAVPPRLTLIRGANGSGKTSLLEAIFMAGRGRSFRTRMTERLIAHEAAYLRIYAETANPAHRIGFEYPREGSYQARLDGVDLQSLAQLPAAFFVEVIDPNIHRLVDEGPAERRRWLDWGVFHVEPQFLSCWLRYSRVLRQRNAALRAGEDPGPWDPELAAQGTNLGQLRARWIRSLDGLWRDTVSRLAGFELNLGYQQGWPADLTLDQALRANLSRDRERGTTLAGPHRADITLRLNGSNAREQLSRGQQKLVASALVLTLLRQLRQTRETPPTLLLDDPAAELDPERLQSLVSLVRDIDCQLIVTSLAEDLSPFGEPERVFHVERGRFQEL